MVSKMVVIKGKWKVNPHYLHGLKTIRTKEPWELKLEEEYRGTKYRYWLGGYFDDGFWIDNVVTKEMNTGDGWVQLEQYTLSEEL